MHPLVQAVYDSYDFAPLPRTARACRQILGCGASLQYETCASRRVRVCRTHLSAPHLIINGEAQRYCMQCNRSGHCLASKCEIPGSRRGGEQVLKHCFSAFHPAHAERQLVIVLAEMSLRVLSAAGLIVVFFSLLRSCRGRRRAGPLLS